MPFVRWHPTGTLTAGNKQQGPAGSWNSNCWLRFSLCSVNLYIFHCVSCSLALKHTEVFLMYLFAPNQYFMRLLDRAFIFSLSYQDLQAWMSHKYFVCPWSSQISVLVFFGSTGILLPRGRPWQQLAAASASRVNCFSDSL